MTRYVIEALRAAGIPASDPAFACARVYLDRCQNFDTDGGFFFTTTEFDTNKAGHDGKRFRSYGTTTADGILALLATGAPLGDERVLAAERWLTRNHQDMNVPGFIGEAYQRWPRGLAFYYAATSSQAFGALKMKPGGSMISELERIQRADGSWSNPENLVKEDDPLIATAFAVRALAALLNGN
jgi:squalene-hopene/tetraprenyl-beta-curcumene cyclase